MLVSFRADSIEAMLAAIPSRFSIEKPLSSDSPSTTAVSSSSHGPARRNAVSRDSTVHPQPVAGTAAAIPSRRSRDVPGLQPEIVALTNAPGPPGNHVTAQAAGNGDMPR